jgi:adenine-specific DNA methylase
VGGGHFGEHRRDVTPTEGGWGGYAEQAHRLIQTLQKLGFGGVQSVQHTLDPRKQHSAFFSRRELSRGAVDQPVTDPPLKARKALADDSKADPQLATRRGKAAPRQDALKGS